MPQTFPDLAAAIPSYDMPLHILVDGGAAVVIHHGAWRDPGGEYLATPGRVSARFASALPDLLANARRIVPWVRVLIAPRILLPDHDDFEGVGEATEAYGRLWRPVGAAAFPRGNVITLSAQMGPAEAFHAVFYQAWRVLESKLADDFLEGVSGDLRQFILPSVDDLDLPDSHKRATAFAAFATAGAFGIPLPEAEDSEAYKLFEDAFNGTLAADLTRYE